MNIELLAYHGTTREAAKLIIEHEHFIKSNKEYEWLGHGVYFYELFEKAQWWSQNKKNPVVIETQISVEEGRLVNLDKPSEEDKFGAFIQLLEKDGGFVFDDDKLISRCQMMNMYMKSVKGHVVIATLLSTNRKYKKTFSRIDYMRTEKQICVHDTSCIMYNKLKVIE